MLMTTVVKAMEIMKMMLEPPSIFVVAQIDALC
jgi:hypothetical protein